MKFLVSLEKEGIHVKGKSQIHGSENDLLSCLVTAARHDNKLGKLIRQAAILLEADDLTIDIHESSEEKPAQAVT